MPARGNQVLFGFPNQNSLAGFIEKLTWQKHDDMDCFIIPVATFPLEKLSKKLPFLKKAYADYVTRTLEQYSATRSITNSVLTGGYTGVLRNDQYLNYKTYTENEVINLKGTRLWIKINNGLEIGDIIIGDQELSIVMRELKKRAGRLGLKQIRIQLSRNTQMHQLFAAHYSAIPSFPVIVKDLDRYQPAGSIKFTGADIDTF